MKKKLLLPFESPREHYKAEATVVWCSDDRFSLALQVFRERMGWRWMDLIRMAGGARDLGTLASQADADSLLSHIGKSVKGNHSPEVFLMAHYNCGAFSREQMDPTDEEDHFFAEELHRGKQAVEEYLSVNALSAKVWMILCDFKNIYEVEA